MKKSILTLSIATLVIGSIVMGCKKDTKQVQDAQESVDSAKVAVKDAEEDLDEAKRAATAAEWQQFKDSTDAKIEENKAKIAELKLKIKKKREKTSIKNIKEISIQLSKKIRI